MVPFYNPGPVVRTTVERCAAALERAGVDYEILAVSDGATDGSEATLAGLLPGRLETVVLPANRGKGHAVRVGMARARGRLIGFIDADGDIPPELLGDFVATARSSGADILFGSKRHPGAQVEVPWVRRLASSAYRLVVRALFRLSVGDTQTGLKLLRAEVARAVLPLMTEERFAFDLELFVLAQRLGYGHFVEVPIRLEKQYRSTVSAKEAATILVDTVKIYWRFRVRSSGAQGGERDAMDAGGRAPEEHVDAC